MFSVSASAEESTSKYQIYQWSSFPNDISGTGYTFIPNNDIEEKQEKEIAFSTVPTGDYYNNLTISNLNGDNLAKKGDSVKISFNNVYNSMLIFTQQTYTTNYTYVRNPSNVYFRVTYESGSVEYFTPTFSKVADNLLNIDVEFEAKADIKSVTYQIKHTDVKSLINTVGGNEILSAKITFYSGEFNGDDKFQFDLNISSEEAGLLKGVLQWLQNLWNGITEIPQKIWGLFESAFSTVFEWLESLWSAIAELPSKLWQLIENGLKSLFVPDDEFIVQFKNDIDSMLSEKLGAVYQVVNISLESWDRISANDQSNIISVPLVSIPLPNNESFSFGGYDVPIVPNGFDFLVDIIKTVVGVVCTILFINGLRKKYDEVMGVEQ